MLQVTPAHAAAQTAPSAEVRFRLLGILNDVAHKDFGASATAGDQFSTDFPPAGAVDGVLHALNFGPAISSEDGIGKSGWKSGTAALTAIRTSKADWNAGTQAGAKTMGDHVELAFGTPSDEQDFDGLTNGTIVGQGWTQVSGAGLFEIVDTGLPSGMEGKALRMTDNADGRIRRLFSGSVPSKQTLTFLANRTIQGSGAQNAWFQLYFRDGTGAVDRFAIRWDAQLFGTGCPVFVGNPAATLVRFATRDVFPYNSTLRVSVDWDHGGDPTNTPVRVWLQAGTQVALQVHEGIYNMTGVNTIDLEEERGAGVTDPVMWIEDLRFGSEFSDDGTQDNVIDHGAAPSQAAALLTFNGKDDRVHRFIPGGQYEIDNQDTLTPIRRTTAPQGRWVGQTFEVTSIAQLDAIAIVVGRTGTPIGNLWVELRDTDGTQPIARVLSRSRPLVGRTYSPTQRVILEFPEPWVLQPSRRYALVVTGDWGLDNANCLTIGVDASAPTYASGQVYDSDDNSTWTARAQDMTFVLYQFHQVETFYDAANRDASVSLGGSASDYLVGQGFKVPRDRAIQHFQVLIRKHEGATFAAADTLRCEVHQDDGTGKSNGVVLARGIEYRASQVTWGGTEAGQVFELMVLSLPSAFLFAAGTQYILVIRPNWAAHATNHLDLGVDNSSASYADGVRSLGSSAATPVWVTTSTSDVIFAALSEHRSHVEFEAAYSADNATYSAFEKITHNPTQVASLANVAFTGQALRYWKIRAILRRRSTVGPARPWTPILLDYTLKVIFATPKVLTIALGPARTVSRFEVYAHPVEAGCRVFKVEVSTNGGGSYSLLSGFAGLEARKRGGGATISEAAGIITTTGDYIAGDFAADVVGATHLRLTVLGNVDEWARVIEFRAFRTVDFGPRVLGDPSVSAQADFTQRRFRAKQFNVSLDNTDGFLSPLGNLGGFNDELGEGVRLLFDSGYKDAPDLVRHGEFFVDNWSEQPQTAIINIAARDLVKMADTEVTAKYKTDKRSWELIEYLMNLANIPSQWMTIDRTASRVKHFAAAEPNAWQESQKIAEAAGLADLFVDRGGYLNFRGSGMSCGDAAIPVIGNTAGSAMSFGPPVMLNSKVYTIASGATTGTKELKLVEYTPETGAWVTIGTIDSFTGTFSGSLHPGGTITVLGGSIYIYVNTILASGNIAARLYSWPGSGSIFSLLAEWHIVGFAGADPQLSPVLHAPGENPSPVFIEDQWYYRPIGITGIPPALTHVRVEAINLLTAGLKIIVFPVTGTSSFAAGECSGAGIESGHRIVSIGQSVTAGIPETKIYTFEPWGQTATLLATLNAASQGHTLGITTTGKGYIYTVNHYAQLGTPAVGAPFNPTFYKIAIPSGTVTAYPQLLTSTGLLGNLRDFDAGAYIDGIFFGGAIQDGALRRLVLLDEDTDRLISPGSLTLAAARLVGFESFTIGGQSWVFGVTDETRFFEAQIRRRRPVQDTEVFLLSSGPDGLLLSANLDHGTDKGGDNRIINLAVVKSEPLIDLPIEVLWNADRLPWTSPAGKLQFKVQLKDPGIALTASITTSPVSSASVSVSGDAVQPEVTITVTTSCNITALSISGRPLRKAGTLVAGAVGPGKSISRFGVRSHVIQNDYVYDTLAAAPIVSWLVINFSDRKTKAEGLQSMLLDNLDVLDLIRLRDDRTGLNAQFFVTGFRHAYRSQRSSLTVLQKAGSL